MNLVQIVLGLLKKAGQSIVKEMEGEEDTDSGLPMSSDTDFKKKERERLRAKTLIIPKFECNVPPYILEKKDVQPHERYMLESQSIIAQKVDFSIETLTEMSDCMREYERELISFNRWKAKFSRRIALLIVLLIAFFTYVVPIFREKVGGTPTLTNAPTRIP
jgi:hypothetical protein